MVKKACAPVVWRGGTAVINSSWFMAYDDAYPIPKDYLAIDLETTGFSREHDMITQMAWVNVIDGRIVDQGCDILDWTPMVDNYWLKRRLEDTTIKMAEKGDPFHMSAERMREEGRYPITVLDEWMDRMQKAVRTGHPLAAHNGTFDLSWICQAIFKRLGIELPLVKLNDLLWDTGTVEKASELGWLPSAKAPRTEWQHYVRNAHSRIKWSQKRCIEKYKLAERFGLNMDQLHDAGQDARVVHLLMEEYRRLAQLERTHLEKSNGKKGITKEADRVRNAVDAQGGCQEAKA